MRIKGFMLVVLVLIFSFLCLNVQAIPVYGDLNSDGGINSIDYALMRMHLLGISAISNSSVADLDGNGSVNSIDFALLRSYLLRIINVFPVQQLNTPVPTATATPMKPSKICALTFDDGPDTVCTEKVLDKLDKYGVTATFFMIGQQINDSTSDVVKRIADSGFEIENHSWDHSSMGSMPADEVKKQIEDTNAAIFKYSGMTPKFFRPPYLTTSQSLFDAVDLTVIGGIAANDWDPNVDAQTRASLILNNMSDGTIILMHCVQYPPQPTPEALDIIIPELQRQGYEFVTVSELFERKGVTLSPTDNNIYTRLP